MGQWHTKKQQRPEPQEEPRRASVGPVAFLAWYRETVPAMDMFDAVDMDGDGRLRNKRELRALARRVRALSGATAPGSLGARLGQQILHRADANGDGALDRHEFLSWYRIDVPALQLFADVDTDGSGYLYAREMRALADRVRALAGGSGRGWVRSMGQRLGRRIMLQHDRNSDGRLSRGEFLRWYRDTVPGLRAFADADADGDGQVCV